MAVGERLRAAQEKLLAGGGRAPLDKASREERELVSRLTREALALARKAGISTSAALEEKIAATLRSAALDEDAAGELRAGRLVRELEAVGLFGAALEPGEGAAAGRRAAPRKDAGTGERSAAADNRPDLEEALKLARGEARRTKRELDAAGKEVRGAEQKAGSAARRAEQASDRAKEASEKAEEAARHLDEARKREREAGRAHERAEAAVDKAERRLGG